MALAVVRPESLNCEDQPEIEVVRDGDSAEPEPVEDDESESTDDDDDDGDETDDEADDDDSEEDDDEEEDSSGHKRTRTFFGPMPHSRSPLSMDDEGEWPKLYNGYHCTIPGCDFAASTSAHVRHHIATASHWFLLQVSEAEEESQSR